jgi:hypothetical protein
VVPSGRCLKDKTIAITRDDRQIAAHLAALMEQQGAHVRQLDGSDTAGPVDGLVDLGSLCQTSETASALTDPDAYDVTDAATADEARELVRDGEVDAAVIPGGAEPLGYTVVFDEQVSNSLLQQLSIAPEVEILEQSLEIIFAGVPHGAGLDVFQDLAEIAEDEIVRLPCPLFRDLVEQFGRFQEIAEALDGFFLDGGEHFLALFLGLVDLVELDAVVLQDLIGEEVHPLGEVFVEDEAEDVVAELIRAHLAAQGVGDVPELGLELFLGVVGHAVDVA